MKNLLGLIFAFTFLLSACATSPTGRKQFLAIPAEQLDTLGADSFKEIQKTTPTTTSAKYYNVTKCVADKLLLAIGENPAEWELKVFVDKSPNAFALPGRKIGVHTGMIDLADNADQLAAVMGHEIGHVLASHGNERMSQGMLANIGMQAAQVALGKDTTTNNLLMAGLGLGARFGVIMPFSRKHESEADYLGQQYMAKAGFDTRAATALWQKMAAAAGGANPPEFLSTHPSNASRIRDTANFPHPPKIAGSRPPCVK